MTEVLHSSCSSPSSSPTVSAPTRALSFEDEEIDKERDQLSLLAILVTLFRKSFWVTCKTDNGELCGPAAAGGMEIGWPTNVRHVAHVTFDRFNGFLGLPVEFEPEVPRRAPSASTTVFGVSTESMQLSFDSRGNSVPTILLLMQRRLYAHGGLQAEGIFRINAENGQEENVRDRLNSGVVPEDIDVHCLAGLIKAWFRELPSGVLDSLSQEQVMQCDSEEDCVALVRLLPATEAALLDWAINLMADVVQEEHRNKMNPHNIAVVFAPNMTQMADPLTAMMYVVQVMNFLKRLIEKALREREDFLAELYPTFSLEPSGENGHQSPPQLILGKNEKSVEGLAEVFSEKEPYPESFSDSNELSNRHSTSTEESDAREAGVLNFVLNEEQTDRKVGRSNNYKQGNGPVTVNVLRAVVQSLGIDVKFQGISHFSRVDSISERVETWR
ncbi:PREDICTED: rho GTPase-activating protein 5-like isoform X2 [Ipomoea nil]|uniref:rho GTPase-activating protein 5-like isoform X2 n=1 Tax=Ipomoea nil TaxID=35883 RepID=UPI000900C74C|nr:PREDICTED: rho GTPase-activating protein 5-like isoform X2 [Ipomoea nil]